MSAPSLYNLQKWLRWAVTDPRGVKAAVDNPSPAIEQVTLRFSPLDKSKVVERYQSPSDSCLEFIDGNKNLEPDFRLSVYAEGYFFRLVESLSLDFPCVVKALGEKEFSKLVADYLKENPSTYSNIGEVGKNLPEFIKCHQVIETFPSLSELAKLEWLCIESFYSANENCLNLQGLSELSADDWNLAQFKLDPSVILVSFDWPVQDIWNFEESVSIENILMRKSFVKIFRQNFKVYVVEIEKLEFDALTLVSINKSLAEICEKLNAEEDAVTRIGAWFSEWLQTGIINEIVLKEKK